MKILLLVFLTFSYTLAASPTVDDDANTLEVLSEIAPIGTLIKTVQVNDPDVGDNIVVSTTDALTNEYTIVNQTTGNNIHFYVYLRKQLDRDRGTIMIKLRFTISDNQGNQHDNKRYAILSVEKRRLVVFTLHINDANDEEPIFQHEPYTMEIAENELPGPVYSKVSASDWDEGYKGLVTYRMEPKSHSPATAEEYNQTFNMDNITGHVILLKKLDFEKNSYYKFTVIAQDMAPPYHNVSTLLIIRVLDVQDTPPFFTGVPYRTSIKEDIPVGTIVIEVSATDGDPSVSNRVAFSIEKGDCSTFFNISDDGVIKTIKQLSRDDGEIKDKSGVCSFPVKVYEINGTEPQYGNTIQTTNVTIMIEDVNNNSPMFMNNTGWFEAEIQENSPTGVPITLTKPSSMDIQDKDQGINSKMYVTLSSNAFIVEPNEVQDYGSLMIRVYNRSVLDYEAQTDIIFQVIVKEAKNSSHVTTASVSLKLIDMNDNNPLFEKNSYTFYINENSINSTDVGHIMASDLDSGANGNVTYYLSGGSGKFLIGQTDGIIRTNVDSKQLDREMIDVYYLTITATDGGGRSNATSVVIHLNDTNDNAPQFQRNEYTAFISEMDTKYNVTPIIIIHAYDNDQPHTDNSKVRYNIASISEPESLVQLRIDEISGSVYLDAPVDFEKLQNNTGVSGEVKVTVEGRDLGIPSLSNTTILMLNIQDEKDNVPICIHPIINGAVLENVTSTLDTNSSDHDNVKHAIQQANTDLLSVIANISAEMQTLKTNQATLQRDMARIQSNPQGGSTYVRWGRTSCPGNGTEQVYSGYTAGSLYSDTGAAVNYLCLSPVAEWAKYTNDVDSAAKIYRAEYEFWNTNTNTKAGTDQRSNMFFENPLLDENVPCSVCRSSKPSVLMIPGRKTCLNGWNLEYAGYLASGAHNHAAATEYICLDANPEAISSGFSNQNGKLFYLVEGMCGSLEYPPYENGRELTCAVCSK